MDSIKIFSMNRSNRVHLTKKSSKWECKMCGEKQSIKRHYGIGTAQECRVHVQKLNVMQGEKNESSLKIKDIDSEDDDYIHTTKEELKESYTNTKAERKSIWTAFIEDNEDPSISNVPEYYEEAEVCLELPKKQKRKMSNKQTANSDEFTKGNYFKKQYHQKDDQIKQKNFTRQNKWAAYTSESENVPNFNEPNCNDDMFLEITPKTSQRYKNTITDTNYIKEKENTKDILCFESNVFINDAKMEDNSENTKTHTVTKQESKWSQFLDTENLNDYKSNDEESHIQKGNKSLFSLCDDNDLDSILEV